MKYKPGQKVKIVKDILFKDYVEEKIAEINPDRIFTINGYLSCEKFQWSDSTGLYTLVEIENYKWEEDWLERVPTKTNRFELIDFEE